MDKNQNKIEDKCHQTGAKTIESNISKWSLDKCILFYKNLCPNNTSIQSFWLSLEEMALVPKYGTNSTSNWEHTFWMLSLIHKNYTQVCDAVYILTGLHDNVCHFSNSIGNRFYFSNTTHAFILQAYRMWSYNGLIAITSIRKSYE